MTELDELNEDFIEFKDLNFLPESLACCMADIIEMLKDQNKLDDYIKKTEEDPSHRYYYPTILVSPFVGFYYQIKKVNSKYKLDFGMTNDGGNTLMPLITKTFKANNTQKIIDSFVYIQKYYQWDVETFREVD